MTDTELKSLTLAKALRLIRRRELSPVELTKAILERAQRLNDHMRAFITITADHALDQARTAERELMSGITRPLHGIPVSVKDLFDTKGIRTTAGSKVFSSYVPEEDSEAVARLNASGCVMIGKTNLHEFAFGATSINPHYGNVRNPWDPNRIAGGSSGGSATSIALSLAFGSLGTDTGGSIRIPASLCGIVGFKPSAGAVSVRGVAPLSTSLDHVGPLAWTVEDVALMFNELAIDRNPRVDAQTSVDGSLKGIRVGIPQTYFFDGLDTSVGEAIRNAIQSLGKLGADLIDVNFPSAVRQFEVFTRIVQPEAYAWHEPHLKTKGDEYSPDLRERIEGGKNVLATDYIWAQSERAVMKDECATIFETADVMITPTTPVAAPEIAQTTLMWDGKAEPLHVILCRFTRPFNLTGIPTISIPCGFTPDGLPIGMQIAARHGNDAMVLRVAAAYEAENKWSERRPLM